MLAVNCIVPAFLTVYVYADLIAFGKCVMFVHITKAGGAHGNVLVGVPVENIFLFLIRVSTCIDKND